MNVFRCFHVPMQLSKKEGTLRVSPWEIERCPDPPTCGVLAFSTPSWLSPQRREVVSKRRVRKPSSPVRTSITKWSHFAFRLVRFAYAYENPLTMLTEAFYMRMYSRRYLFTRGSLFVFYRWTTGRWWWWWWWVRVRGDAEKQSS